MSRPFALVHELLDAAAVRHPTNPAVRDRDERRDYAQLRRNSLAVAAWLADAGVGPGGRVVCLLPARCHTVELLFATVRLGAAFVPCAPRATDYELRWLLDDAQPSLVVAPAAELPRLRRLTTAPVVAMPARYAPVDIAATPASRVRPDDPALLLYTSGSTARPKAVVCPHAQVVFAATAIADRLGYRPDDVVYLCLPLSFDYGLYQLLLCALAGAELVLRDDRPDGSLLRDLRQTGTTVLPAVPTLIELLTWLATRDRAPTAVRLVTNTGAALTPAHAARLRAALPDARTVAMYGTTECKRITIAEPDEHLDRPGTAGRPLPGTRVVIVDDAGRELPPGEVGQIVAIGPHVMAGYWRAPEATAERFRPAPDGSGTALYTGDFGHLDEAGRLYFAGRRDDLFKRRGVRVSVAEIEAAMLDIPGVRLAAVLPPAPDGRLVAWAASRLTARDILAGIAERLGRAKVPDECLVVDDLPRTANGKIDKRRLADRRVAGVRRQ